MTAQLTVWLPPDSQNCFCGTPGQQTSSQLLTRAGGVLHTTARDAVASGESPLRLGVDPSPPPVWGQRKLVVVTVLMAPPFDKSNHGTKATRWAFQDHSPFVGLFLMVPSTLFILKPFMIAVMLSSEGSKMGLKRWRRRDDEEIGEGKGPWFAELQGRWMAFEGKSGRG